MLRPGVIAKAKASEKAAKEAAKGKRKATEVEEPEPEGLRRGQSAKGTEGGPSAAKRPRRGPKA
ncbi:hypothetical protein C8F04DRAFT_1258054 [Mycena alexandri]|uniref:Uncharacterized protein n=1 Tax=Mycena alexandri TaxID=1745969 RepID=A0AAD6X8Y0_9AGAR|nr:hypothetical protein C8F04DRAFT_1258054 [Mycena alexandri]